MNWLVLVSIIFLLTISANAQYVNFKEPDSMQNTGRMKSAGYEFPEKEYALLDVGKFVTTQSNYGSYSFGTYPKQSNISYFRSRLWIGGVVGNDTLVSLGGSVLYTSELNPDAGDAGLLIKRSILRSNDYFHRDAVSELDIIAVFTDTFTNVAIAGEDQYDNRSHKPLGIQVKSSAYAWSAEYLEDIVLYDFVITNIGESPISDMYIGFRNSGTPNYLYDLEYKSYKGFRTTLDYPDGACVTKDTVNMVWMAGEDGQPNEAWEWDYRSPRAVIGLQLLRPTANEKKINYNWYGQYQKYDWGPRLIPTYDDPWRDMFGSVGYPHGDKNKYYMLSHPEVDYDQMFTMLSHTDDGFMPQPGLDVALEYASGMLCFTLYSFGPYNLQPGDSMQFTLAVFAGENFHVNPTDFRDYFDPFNPQVFYDKLDFSDLALNSRRARMIFDNPGFDTNGDGYSGEFCWEFIWRYTTDGDPPDSVLVDSIRRYYSGDGVPDFRAMMPPPPPNLRVIPENGKMTLRWNGQESETTPDVFSGNLDFEGYRVYYAEDNRQASYTLLASYDIDDYLVYEFDPFNLFWNRITQSAKLDSLRDIYGPDFDPSIYYDEFNSFHDRDTDRIFYFVSQDWNQSDLNNPLKIHKVYPDASPDDPTDLTAEGWMRYYEYEYTVDNLAPARPFYFGVTAFDYGASAYDIGALETSPTTNAIREYATLSADSVEHLGLKVIVYPNPYRIDGGYARDGYENRDRTRAVVWSRRIHFANLPNICTIRIYTITGDLVQEIKHYNPDGGPESQHEEWNVISRNTQGVVTGVYLWSVRSEMGEQIGKLVIIK